METTFQLFSAEKRVGSIKAYPIYSILTSFKISVGFLSAFHCLAFEPDSRDLVLWAPAVKNKKIKDLFLDVFKNFQKYFLI